MAEQANRMVQYADKKELEENLLKRYPPKQTEEESDPFLTKLRERRMPSASVRID